MMNERARALATEHYKARARRASSTFVIPNRRTPVRRLLSARGVDSPNEQQIPQTAHAVLGMTNVELDPHHRQTSGFLATLGMTKF